jgi:type IV pilus assembly protein PilA
MSEVILAMSACRTTITEVYQTGGTPPAPNQWGCGEIGSATPILTKYVAGLSTNDDGVITATIQNVSSDVNTKTVTLIPLSQANTPANSATDMGVGLYGWICGSTGSTIDKKFLPGSCRGI